MPHVRFNEKKFSSVGRPRDGKFYSGQDIAIIIGSRYLVPLLLYTPEGDLLSLTLNNNATKIALVLNIDFHAIYTGALGAEN